MIKKSRFKKNVIYTPVEGFVKGVESVNDEMFACKIMGDGFAVCPQDSMVYSPVVGEIVSVFPTKHAIFIESNTGLEVLVHIGIDTVELDGKPFEIKVKSGDFVNENTLLAVVDFELIEQFNKNTDVIVIFTNLDDKLFILDEQGYLFRNTIVGKIE